MKNFISLSLFATIIISIFSSVSYAYNVIPLDINFPEKRVIKVLYNDAESPTPTPKFVCNTTLPEPTPTQGCTYFPICGKYGALSYEIRDSKVKIVSCDESAVGEIDIPNEIEGYPVTELADWLFSYFKEISGVRIPANVSDIDKNVFFDCNGLNKIEVDELNRYFSSDNGVLFNKAKTKLIQYPIGKTDVEYIVPEGVTSIGDYSFLSCANLNNIKMPKGLKTIGEGAFKECTDLDNVEIPKGTTYIGAHAFHGCGGLIRTVIPETVTNIDIDAFNGCENLTIYGIENSYAEGYANENSIDFSVLEEFIVENGILTEYNGSGGDIVIPGDMGITSIGKYVFCNNQSITSVEIPDGIELIGDGAFMECTNLKSVSFPTNYFRIAPYAFGGAGFRTLKYPKNCSGINWAFYGCENLKEVIIEEGVTSLSTGLFDGCSSLKTVTLPSTCTFILPAFKNCGNLTEIILSDGIPKVLNGIFYKCSAIKKIYIPDSATEIESGAFTDCESLEAIVVPNSVTQIGENVITNCDKAVIYSEPDAYAREYAEANNIPWADIKTLNGGWNWETSIEKGEDKENTYICTAKNVSTGKKTGEFIAAYYDEFGNMLGSEIKSLNRNSGEKETIRVTIPENGITEIKKIKAFVWDSFANMNAVSQYAEYIINN